MPAQLDFSPPEENVTSRLHKPADVHNAMTVVGLTGRARIRLEHLRARFLNLEKQWIPFARHHQPHSAKRADAADSDHLDCDVLQLITIEEHAPVFLHALAIIRKCGLCALE